MSEVGHSKPTIVRDLGHILLFRKGIQFSAGGIRNADIRRTAKMLGSCGAAMNRYSHCCNLGTIVLEAEFADWNERGPGCI